MTQKVREVKGLAQELENTTEIAACHHHWVIEQSLGHTSHGVCKVCGTMREFLNSMPDYSPFLEARGKAGHNKQGHAGNQSN